jgi:hypothetical protein
MISGIEVVQSRPKKQRNMNQVYRDEHWEPILEHPES